MAKYVPDIQTHRWVIIASARTKRPSQDDKKRRGCIFCPGGEHLTPKEVFRIGEGEPDKPGWKVRVIPNKFPITDIHEVIIHSPWKDKDIEQLPPEHVEMIFRAYKQRYNAHKDKGQVLIFCNHGLHAGASLIHPHSQLVVLPRQINLDTVVREPIQNIVKESANFISYCPDFSQWPYEVWVIPKAEKTLYGDIENKDIKELTVHISRLTKRLAEIYEKNPLFANIDKTRHEFGYNYYIYPKESWYLRIIPRFVHRAGFELGTGLSVNVVDPSDAAEELRKK